MSAPDRPQPKEKTTIKEAEWLKPGWIVKLKKGGGIHVVQASKKTVPAERAHASAIIIDELVGTSDGGAIFMSKEDCSLVLEYYPELLKSKSKRKF